MLNNELVLDIICRKRRNIELSIEKLSSLGDGSQIDIASKEEEKEILDELFNRLCNSLNAFKELKGLLKKLKSNDFVNLELSKITEINLIKKLIYEYKKEYKKTFLDNKIVGVSGLFNNELFCGIIKRRIDKHTNCNKITKAKYEHEVAFLQEFLLAMEKSKNPLKTLKRKILSYRTQKKDEYVKVRNSITTKIAIVEEILQSYREEKKKYERCK